MQVRKHGGFCVLVGMPRATWRGVLGGLPRAELRVCEGPVLSLQLLGCSKPCLPGLIQLQFSVSTLQHRNHQYYMAASKDQLED